MNFKSTFATAALLASVLALTPAFAAEQAGGAATAPGQTKAAGQPAAPAAKAAAPGQTGEKHNTVGAAVSADCAKLTEPKAKDECVKKAQAAAGAPAATTTGSTTKQ